MDIEKICRRSYSAIARVPFKLVFGESFLPGINRTQYTNQRGRRVSKSECSVIHNNVERKSQQGAGCEAKGIVERCTRSWQRAVVSGAVMAGGAVGDVEIAAEN